MKYKILPICGYTDLDEAIGKPLNGKVIIGAYYQKVIQIDIDEIIEAGANKEMWSAVKKFMSPTGNKKLISFLATEVEEVGE